MKLLLIALLLSMGTNAYLLHNSPEVLGRLNNLSFPTLAGGGSSAARTPSSQSSDILNAADFGAVCDNATNTTAAIQSAIDHAYTVPYGKIRLPAGRCIISGLTVTRPVTIQGVGVWATQLVLARGSTTPAISINITKGTFNPSNGQPAVVAIRDLMITSPSRIDPPGIGLAHGVAMQNVKPAYHATRVLIENVLIGEVPGDGIHCAGSGGGYPGWFQTNGVTIQYVGGYGLYANSCSDGNIYQTQIAGALLDGVMLSGGVNWVFDGVNFYVNEGNNINVFRSDFAVFSNCDVSLSKYSGARINLAADQRINFNGCEFRWNSTSANATHSDMLIATGNAGDVYISDSRFKAPVSSPSASKPLNNIQFSGGTTGNVYTSNVNFLAGAVTSKTVTNMPDRVLQLVVNDLNVTRNANIGGTLNVKGSLTFSNASIIMSALPSDAATTTNTVCRRTDTNALTVGSGSLGICLGTSSARYKNSVADEREGLAEISALRPVTYRYNEGYGDGGAKEMYGFTAEDVLPVLPKLVGLDQDGRPSTLDMMGMIPVMVKAIQELKADNDAMRRQLNGR